MGQTGRSKHEAAVMKKIHRGHLSGSAGILGEAYLWKSGLSFAEGVGCSSVAFEVSDQTELGKDIPGDDDGNEDGRYRVGKNHNAVLSDLRIGNAFHSAQTGVKKTIPPPIRTPCQ